MNRKIGVQIIILLLTFLFITTATPYVVQSAPPVSQETIIVDTNGNGDYTSIKEAIANANITDIILIRRGAYNEHDLVISKKIEIIGEDPTNTIINCSGNVAFTLISSFIDISNLQIINTGEYAITTLPESIGCMITNCIINIVNSGIAIDIRSSLNTISDCNIIGVNNSRQGIKIHGSNNIVRNCEIQDFSNGVLIILDSNSNEILNCNIINNENAIDIRANSNNNVITGCNIYSNLQSIRIWQNSNNNIVSLNNFWKNDVDAIDEDNNTWDNEVKGNYWDKYRGIDANGDGIGDTPFIISEEKVDRFPIISIILPDILTNPANVKVITSKSDNTPTFTWSPSIYSKGIKGYYVKIDSDPEIFIGNLTTWTAAIPQFDGVHKFYVKSESLDNQTSNYTIKTYIIDTTIIDTDSDGWSDSEELLYGTDPNNQDNYPLDTDGDHGPDSVDTDDDNDGYSDEMEESYATDSKTPSSYPLDTDKDGIPNDDSPDNLFKGDEDDDNDGLDDSIETEIGSDTSNALDSKRVYIAGKQYYLVDLNQNNIFDALYNLVSKDLTAVEKRNNSYLIDINGDNTWDYIYNIEVESISAYSEQVPLSPFIWLALILVIILPILVVIFYYLRRKPTIIKTLRKPKKLIKKSLIKEPLKIPISDKKDTLEMVTQTKALLQQIQSDVEVYMEKLNEIEDQFILPTITEVAEEKEVEVEIEKEEEKLFEEKPTKDEKISGIENKVDQILLKSKNK